MKIKSNIIRFNLFLLTMIKLTQQTNYPCNSSLPCGCSMNSASVSRIVGGETAGINTWGWTVSLEINGNSLCGGSIISDSWILTAAHCFHGATNANVTVYPGSNMMWTSTQSRTAIQVIEHPAYDSSTFINDIALLQMDSPLNMSDPTIAKICLPALTPTLIQNQNWPPVGAPVIAAGWGTLSEGGSVSQNLQQVTVNIVNSAASTCSILLTNSQLQMCAGVTNGGKDTCQGDSGGPLMIFNQNTQWFLAGLTSNGVGCARANYSGVYTRVASYQSWISSHVNDSIWININSNALKISGSIFSILLVNLIKNYV